jgi:hypothetical protein
MKAKVRLFNFNRGIAHFEVAEFLSELGPKRVISVSSTNQNLAVFYWDEDPGMSILKDINSGRVRCGVQPASIPPTPPPPGTLMS